MDKKKRSGKLLVVRLSSIGDVAMTIPAVYSMARQYPDLQIHYLTQPQYAGLLACRPANVEVVAADFDGEHAGAAGMARLLRRLGREGYTAVADLHNVLRSWIIDWRMRLGGAKVRMLNKKRNSRVQLVVNHVSQQPFYERFAEVLERLGYPVEIDFKSVYGPERPLSPIEVRHPAVGVAPFARFDMKIYPLEPMRRVIDALLAKGCAVYLYGGGEREVAALRHWAKSRPGCECVAGRFSIADELAAMAQMDVMIAMDSANLHLASIAGTRAISIWGCTVPQSGYLDFTQSIDDAICLGLPCQPCTVTGVNHCPLGHADCMRRISPEEVAAKALAALGL